MNQFDWITGLDRSGWIAAGLFIIFFIIAILTVAMMLKMRTDEKKEQRSKPVEDVPPTKPPPTRPAPEKAAVKDTPRKTDDSNPLEEAEVFLTYGLKKQAIDLLEKHLKENPSDKAAFEILKRAKE